MADRFEKFTEGAHRVLTSAQEEARRFRHNYIGTEHLLLGLLRVDDAVAAVVHVNLGLRLDAVRQSVENMIGRGEGRVHGEIGLTPRAKRVLELAVDEARGLDRGAVATEHILLGLVREGEGIAAGVLESAGVNERSARDETVAVLSRQPAEVTSDQPVAAAPATPVLRHVPDRRHTRLHAARRSGLWRVLLAFGAGVVAGLAASALLAARRRQER